MKRLLLTLVAFSLVSSSAFAAVLQYEATLTGNGFPVPINTEAFGNFSLTVRTTEGSTDVFFDFTIDVTGIAFQDLDDNMGRHGPNETAFHLHQGDTAEEHGPIVIDLASFGAQIPKPGEAIGFTLSAADQLYSPIQPHYARNSQIDTGFSSEDFLTLLAAQPSQLYVALHSAPNVPKGSHPTGGFPSGHIRGQLEVIPEPSTTVLFLAGAGIFSVALGGAKRRAKRRLKMAR